MRILEGRNRSFIKRGIYCIRKSNFKNPFEVQNAIHILSRFSHVLIFKIQLLKIVYLVVFVSYYILHKWTLFIML